jgi:ATP-dependent Lon protease
MKTDTDDKLVLLVSQKDSLVDNPTEKDLYKVGILGHVLQMLKLPDGTVKVLVEGKCGKFFINRFQRRISYI